MHAIRLSKLSLAHLMAHVLGFSHTPVTRSRPMAEEPFDPRALGDDGSDRTGPA